MDLKEAKLILEEVKDLDDSIFQYAPGYLEALETVLKPQWIPVTERLPKETGLYLVTLKTTGINAFKDTHPNGFVYIALWDGISMRWGYNDKYVTAWMPLPEPFMEDV